MSRRTGTAAVVLAVLSLTGFFIWKFRSSPQRSATTHREIALRVLGQFLAEKHPSAAVLALGNPFSRRRDQPAEVYRFEESSLRGLQAGIGPAATVRVAYPSVRSSFDRDPSSVRIDPQTTTPLSFLIEEGAFDAAARAHPECKVIVSWIGIPADMEKQEVWRPNDSHQFALFAPDWRLIGDLGVVRALFKSGKLIAAVLPKPGAPDEQTDLPGTIREQFDQRFLLVTSENLEELAAQYPRAF
jgi:hypothetical protein